jgi:citrate lyase subunit beta / citryl-CoA lyase
VVETAVAVLGVAALAATPGVIGLAMGEVDLAADLGIVPSAGEPELAPIRAAVVVASAAAGIASPVGPVWTEVGDADGLDRSTRALARAGFGSRQAIHPAQIAVIHAALAPSAEEIDRAEALVAMEGAEGGVFLDAGGRMVDVAVIRNARRLLGRRR